MSRSSHGAVDAGRPDGAAGWRLRAGRVLASRSSSRSSPAPARRPARSTTVVLGSTATDARPLLPGAALPGGRQRHRLPGQQRPGEPALPRPARRQGQGLDADPGPADQQPALLLQRLLRHPAARRAWRSCAASRAPTRPATTCAARARSRSSAPTSARRSGSAPRCRSRRATSSASRSRPGPRPSPRACPTNNVWRASREPGNCTNATDVRQGEPQEKVGRRATYGCRYTTARLLYTATVVEG